MKAALKAGFIGLVLVLVFYWASTLRTVENEIYILYHKPADATCSVPPQVYYLNGPPKLVKAKPGDDGLPYPIFEDAYVFYGCLMTGEPTPATYSEGEQLVEEKTYIDGIQRQETSLMYVQLRLPVRECMVFEKVY
jgi:hypothetical protein